MNLSTILKKWCADNHRALVTPEERAAVILLTSEVERVRGHYAKYRVGLALEEFRAARQKYANDPSEENRAALDDVGANWMEKDRANGTQRSLISLSLNATATKGLKALCPAILRRAANAVAWLSLEVTSAEMSICERFEHPFVPLSLVKALAQEAANFRIVAGKIENPRYESNCTPDGIIGLQWLPDLLQVEGEVWNADTLDPREKRSSKKFRNIGQIGNTLFDPVMTELDGTAAAAPVKGKDLVRYPDAPVKPFAGTSINLDDPAVKDRLLAGALAV